MISFMMNKINQTENKKEQEEQTVVNGVNVTKLSGVIGAIVDNPSISQFNFRAKGRWINGAHN
jgi:hypothetical protein